MSLLHLPTYITPPSTATQIPPPRSKPPSNTDTHTKAPPPRAHLPSFPPSTSSSTQSNPPPTRKLQLQLPTTSTITTNVSDLLLSSFLPPNLPKLPSAPKTGNGEQDRLGPRPRELSTQKEALSLPLVSYNFRRFITKVGPIFWLQDRVEEILYWRKPKWTLSWLLLWTFISFQPRILLILPSLTLLILLLSQRERSHPVPSLYGVPIPLAPGIGLGTDRVNPQSKIEGTSTSIGSDGEAIPVVPPKEAESGVDYYMNLQAIQNLMGQMSDIYDYTLPHLNLFTSLSPSLTPSLSPTSPIKPQHSLIALLIPTLLLPLTPPFLIPYLILPIGLLPPMIFHPNLNPLFLALPRHRTVLFLRSVMMDMTMTDSLSDEIGAKKLGRVGVWENERVDPAFKGSNSGSGMGSGVWSSKFLRSGERGAWVKVRVNDTAAGPSAGAGAGAGISAWAGTSQQECIWAEDEKDTAEGSKMGLDLKPGWNWIPNEEWWIDTTGLWSDVGTDEEGWVYSDDSWLNASSLPMPMVDEMVLGMAGRRVTRRRRWLRRVYLDQ